MISPGLLVSVFLALALPSAAVATTAEDVVKRSESADKYVSYRGLKTASIHFGDETRGATLKTLHLKPDKTRTEYFSPQTLAGVIVIHSGSSCYRYRPKDRFWQECPGGGMSEAEARKVAFENYDMRLIGTDTVAGRPTYVVYAVPKSPTDAAHRLWVDREFFLVIGTQVESRYGSVLTSSRFTSIEFNPDDIDPSVFKVTGKVRPCCKAEPSRKPLAEPSYLPRGYRLVGTASLSVSGRSCAHLQFSNGVNTISLFQRPATGSSVSPPKRRTTEVLTWTRDGTQFTLMGRLPLAELRKIADSVK